MLPIAASERNCGTSAPKGRRLPVLGHLHATADANDHREGTRGEIALTCLPIHARRSRSNPSGAQGHDRSTSCWVRGAIETIVLVKGEPLDLGRFRLTDSDRFSPPLLLSFPLSLVHGTATPVGSSPGLALFVAARQRELDRMGTRRPGGDSQYKTSAATVRFGGSRAFLWQR